MKKFVAVLFALMFVTSVASASSSFENILASKTFIQRVTGMQITDFWSWEFKQNLTADKKMLMTSGAVELNNDGVKRLFWCHFDSIDLTPLRLKIGGQVLYSVLGW